MNFLNGIVNKLNHNLSFEQNGLTMKIIYFNKKKMNVDVDCYDKNDKFIKKMNIVFAQIPKKLKLILNPKK